MTSLQTLNKFRIPALLAVLVVFIVFPLVFSNPAVTSIAIFTLIFAAAGTAWNIFSGYTGYIALGHAAYFGIGCYTIAILCQDWHIQGGWGPFWTVPIAGVLAALVAIPTGAIALRTRKHTFIVITIAIFFIAQLMAYNLRGLTGGSQGLSLPFPLWDPGVYNLPFYYVILAILLVALAASWWVRNSKFGLGLLAIRDDEDRARGLGVKTVPMKLTAFVISAFFVGMCGAVWAYFLGSIYPPFAFDALFDVTIALMAFMGGLGTLSGPIIGAVILIPAQQYFTLYYGQNGYYLILYGALFLVVILLLPQGIVPSVSRLWVKVFTPREAPAMPPAPQMPASGESPGSGGSQGFKTKNGANGKPPTSGAATYPAPQTPATQQR
ncbi:MAG TPA: branched-chain amino acid ABC transporter permease [Ktedonobacterales bacterium]|nr:branched-chain amino acid ABC transporter permease [Ktedonobacterales bacterium]